MAGTPSYQADWHLVLLVSRLAQPENWLMKLDWTRTSALDPPYWGLLWRLGWTAVLACSNNAWQTSAVRFVQYKHWQLQDNFTQITMFVVHARNLVLKAVTVH